MCGLIFSINRNIHDQLQLLNHRGPDSEGFKVAQLANNELQYGHKRLAIQDVTPNGEQPMISESGRFEILFNGEIYNHVEMSAKYGLPENTSDTRALLQLIDLIGVKSTVSELNGMFALLVVDNATATVFAVRDRFGVKPLYYRYDAAEQTAEFGSELKIFSTPAPLDLTLGLKTIYGLRCFPGNQTQFSDVSKVEPGQIIALDLHSWNMRSEYFCKPKMSVVKTEEAERRNALYTAVQRQLISDVPVGILLSGGIDSALLAKIVVDLGVKPQCFCVGYDPRHSASELDLAEKTADYFNLDLTKIVVTEEQILDNFIEVFRIIEGPTATTSVFPMYFLAEGVSKTHKVVLSGQGVDEMDFGYSRYRLDQLYLRYGKMLGPFAKFLATLGCLLPAYARQSLGSISQKDLLRYYAMSRAASKFHFSESNVIENREFSRVFSVFTNDGWADRANNLGYLDMRMGLAEDLLMYTDKIMMAHSVEARVPYLDNDYFNVCMQQSGNLKCSFTKNKLLHKNLATKLLPAEIVNRKKLGFEVPLFSWLSDDLGIELINKIRKYHRFPFISELEQSLKKIKDGKDYSKEFLILLSYGLNVVQGNISQ